MDNIKTLGEALEEIRNGLNTMKDTPAVSTMIFSLVPDGDTGAVRMVMSGYGTVQGEVLLRQLIVSQMFGLGRIEPLDGEDDTSTAIDLTPAESMISAVNWEDQSEN